MVKEKPRRMGWVYSSCRKSTYFCSVLAGGECSTGALLLPEFVILFGLGRATVFSSTPLLWRMDIGAGATLFAGKINFGSVGVILLLPLCEITFGFAVD